MSRSLIIALGALLTGACATPYPCYNVRTDNTTWQTGVVVPFGKGARPTTVAGHTCPSTINSDYLDPPFPFDDNMQIPQ